MKKRIFLIGSALVVLSACTTSAGYKMPEIRMPEQWRFGGKEETTPLVKREIDWWKSFENEELNGLIEKALSHNTDLAVGIEQVAQARAMLKKTGAALWPSADLSAGATRRYDNPSSGKSTYSTSLSSGVGISYELDLFGKNRANIESAKESLNATGYNVEALSLVVTGDVVQNYFTLLNLRERLSIADKNLENAKETLRIIRARVREGSEADLELAQQESAVASDEASRVSIDESIKNTENALAVLLGEMPHALDIKGRSLKDIHVPAIALEQPSTLLESRPDIRAAEARLKAANADIAVARAAFYPSLSLGLNDSIVTTGFGDPTATAFSLASALTAPLFRGGELEGALESATAYEKELVQTYYKTVLEAFLEVEEALVALDAAQKREKFMAVSVQNAQRAYDISKARYDAGSIDFQTLLDTQASLLNVEDSFSQTKLDRLSASVDLFKAMGGGVDLLSAKAP